MRGIIIGSGNIKDYDYIRSLIKEDDCIICADGGYNHAKKMGLIPSVVIGDMDSITDFDDDVKTIKYPCDKDFTDGELCVKYAKEQGIDEILLLAMTSERLDHTLSNIMMMSAFANSKIVDEANEIYFLRDRLTIENKKGKSLSIIPVNGDMEGITTQGLLYPLHNETLYFGECRGNSNVITEDKCEIRVQKGMSLVVLVI